MFSALGASDIAIRRLSATAMSAFRLYGFPRYCKVKDQNRRTD
jgi:hypothetical protein